MNPAAYHLNINSVPRAIVSNNLPLDVSGNRFERKTSQNRDLHQFRTSTFAGEKV